MSGLERVNVSLPEREQRCNNAESRQRARELEITSTHEEKRTCTRKSTHDRKSRKERGETVRERGETGERWRERHSLSIREWVDTS